MFEDAGEDVGAAEVGFGDTPGADGQLNSLTQQLTNGDIDSFTNHVWAQCCTPTKRKRFTHDQTTILVEFAARLP